MLQSLKAAIDATCTEAYRCENWTGTTPTVLVSGFGFVVPADATITHITCTVQHSDSSTATTTSLEFVSDVAPQRIVGNGSEYV